ncbi:MAG: LysE family transporter [Photobacterium frigidiphilum]|uniref:LysE family translocator n=1 Tax=Photobacterium frigidiphilum TaxID=264736 RepID=UPI003001B38A
MELMFTQYLTELVAVISITILTIVTPGPDFVVVARNSLTYSKRSGVLTAVGVASAVWVHIFYTLAGIGLLLSKSILLFSIVKYLGAAYLIYLGISCIKSNGDLTEVAGSKCNKSISGFKSVQMGFFNNVLNPKATLFFVSLFTQLVSPSTPLGIQIAYGAIVSISCLVWFTLVAIFLNRESIKKAFLRAQKTIEKVMGTVLIGFGVKVAISTTN